MLSHLALAALAALAPLAAAYTPLSDSFLRAIPSGADDLDPVTGALLSPIMIPRVPNTPEHTRVQEHLASFFRNNLPRWTIEWQNSTSKTPISGSGEVPFRNLVVRREPPWVAEGQSNLLTLVAHYDSKLKPDGFIGATDSAVPCAVLMHVARELDTYITRMHDEMDALGEGGTTEMDMGIQILFLDGEEAFVSWTSSDSLYGSRSLASAWEDDINPPLSNYRTRLGQISMFVLLDLLGSSDPSIPSYFATTHWAYRSMASIESRMRGLGLLESTPTAPFFPQGDIATLTSMGGGISDDHLPFMFRGVPILHVIPSPFPKVWHTIDDDAAHLDMPTVRDWARIVTAFAMEWLDMMEVWEEPGQRKRSS